MIKLLTLLVILSSCLNSNIKYSDSEEQADNNTTTTTLPTIDSSRGNSVDGQTHYNTHCSSCHGSNGTGGAGPDITNIDDASLGYFVINGAPGMPDNSQYNLSVPDDIEDIGAYIANGFQP